MRVSALRRLLARRPRPDDDECLTRGEWRHSQRCNRIAYGVLVMVSVGACYGSYTANKNSTDALREASHAAVLNGCMQRVEGRVVQAQALDAVRRAALRPPRSRAERINAEQFLERTQRPIEDQLTRASAPNATIVPARDRVRIPPDVPLTDDIVRPIRQVGIDQCRHAADQLDRESR